MICRAGKGDLCGIHLQACDHLHIRGLCTNHVKPTKVTNGHQLVTKFQTTSSHLLIQKRNIFQKLHSTHIYVQTHSLEPPFQMFTFFFSAFQLWTFHFRFSLQLFSFGLFIFLFSFSALDFSICFLSLRNVAATTWWATARASHLT